MPFDWIPSTHPDSTAAFASIVPITVLYDFDGPIVFVAGAESLPLLCYKSDETEDRAQFIVVMTNGAIVRNLVDGKLPLRVALEQARAWIADCDNGFNVSTTWSIGTDDIPETMLPENGYGIYHHHGIISERNRRAEPAFFSVHFQGRELTDKTMPFSVFVGLVNQVFESAKRIFLPPLRDAAPDLSNVMLGRALDMPLCEPMFSSLLIEMKRPRLNTDRINDMENVNLERAREGVIQANDFFLKTVDEVTDEARHDRLRGRITQEQVDTIGIVADFLPSSESFFESVVIKGRGVDDVIRTMTIDSEAGQRILDVVHAPTASRKTFTGKVVEISDRSSSFIMLRRNYREVTCVATLDPLQRAFKSIERGATVTVEGNFQERSRRDKLWVDKIIIDGRQTTA